MKHPSIETLSDYVRGVLSEDVAASAKRHLDSGCKHCERQVAGLDLVRRVAATDREVEVSPHALRAVGNLFRIQRLLAESTRRSSGLSLAFDSDLAPAMSATRRAAEEHRQLVYASPELTLDLHLRSDSDHGPLRLRGQISHSSSDPIADVPVFLLEHGEVQSRDVSGEEGGFHLIGKPKGAARLCFLLEDDELIDLELPSL